MIEDEVYSKVYLVRQVSPLQMIETKYSKILVGVDGSKESMDAANHAMGLAKKDNAELICLTALQLPSFYGWSAIESPQEWQKKDRLQREEWINNIVQTANKIKLLKALCLLMELL